MNFAEVKAAADKGSPAAQFELGERFYYGKGILKDSTEAVEWWRKAAIQNFPPAEYELGLAYGLGNGVPKDKEEGSKWCRMAADAKLPVAEDFEGIAYTLGKTGATQNYSEAFRWFKSAADQNYPPSQYRLALCYRDGKGTPANSSESIVWFQRAASNGVANAQFELGRHFVYAGFVELGIPTQINPNFILTKKQMTNQNFINGVKWLRSAANQGYCYGQVDLALAYKYGLGMDKDPIEAWKWLALASIGDSNFVKAVLEMDKTNGLTFTPEQISAGKQCAEEFSKTNQIPTKSVKEISGL